MAEYQEDVINIGNSDINRHVDFLDGYLLIAKGNHLSFADISDKGFSAVYDESTSEHHHYEKESIVHVSADETKF